MRATVSPCQRSDTGNLLRALTVSGGLHALFLLTPSVAVQHAATAGMSISAYLANVPARIPPREGYRDTGQKKLLPREAPASHPLEAAATTLPVAGASRESASLSAGPLDVLALARYRLALAKELRLCCSEQLRQAGAADALLTLDLHRGDKREVGVIWPASLQASTLAGKLEPMLIMAASKVPFPLGDDSRMRIPLVIDLGGAD